MSSQLDLFSRFFVQIANAKESIRLINAYKGFPISYEAYITGISSSAIQIRSEQNQIVCLYHERETNIQSSYLPRILRAKVSQVDFATNQAVLTQFTYVSGGVGKRGNIRVEPQEVITGVVRQQERGPVFDAQLADIASEGIGIYIDRSDFSPSIFFEGNELSLFLQLPITLKATGAHKVGIDTTPVGSETPRYTWIHSLPPIDLTRSVPHSRMGREINVAKQPPSPDLKVRGVVANINPRALPRKARVGIRIYPNDPARKLIDYFINQRQSEIIRELRAEYEELLKPKE